MSENKNKIRNITWWFFATVGLFIGLANSDSHFKDSQPLAMGLVGIVNGAWIGWLFGWIIDKIRDSAFFKENLDSIDKKELKTVLSEIYTKIFPGGTVQFENEVRELRKELDFKYPYEDLKQTYAHACGIYFSAEDKSEERIVTSILINPKSVVTKSDAKFIYTFVVKNLGARIKITNARDAINIVEKMFNVAFGGVVEMKPFKDLTDYGKFEILLFNSYFTLTTFKNRFPNDETKLQNKYIALLINQGHKYGIHFENSTLQEFIINRLKYYSNLIPNSAKAGDNFARTLYYTFYVNPLSISAKASHDYGQIVSFMEYLNKLIQWNIKYSEIAIKDSSNNSTSKVVKSEVSFFDTFSVLQKASVIRCLIVILKADGKTHPKELAYVEEAAAMLNVDTDDPLVNRLLTDNTKHEMLRHLNTLNESQKEWLVVMMHGMILSDGEADQKEINYSMGISQEIGISHDKYFSIISKSEKIATRVFDKSSERVNEPTKTGSIKQVLSAELEVEFQKSINDMLNKEGIRGTPLEGIMTMTAIANASKVFKETFITNKSQIGLTEEEISELVNKVSVKMIERHGTKNK